MSKPNAPDRRTILIIVQGGLVQDVLNIALPYVIVDFDNMETAPICPNLNCQAELDDTDYCKHCDITYHKYIQYHELIEKLADGGIS